MRNVNEICVLVCLRMRCREIREDQHKIALFTNAVTFETVLQVSNSIAWSIHQQIARLLTLNAASSANFNLQVSVLMNVSFEKSYLIFASTKEY